MESLIVTLVIGVAVYLIVKIIVGLVAPIAKYAEACGIIAGVLVVLSRLGVGL